MDAEVAQGIIADVYALIRADRDSGLSPVGVVLSPDMHDVIETYRAHLGELPGGDYLSKYELFGLPIFIEPNIDRPRLMRRD